MKIAHISDFHARRHVPGHPILTERRSRRMPQLIETAVDDIRSVAPDVLVVTGDLVDAPFYGMEDPETVRAVKQDLLLIRDLIDPVGCPVFYLFGNHDHRGAFEEVFPDQATDTVIEGYRIVTFNDEEEQDNTAERLGPERERFDRVLADDDPTPQIHLQHYMIWPQHNEGYPHAYREAFEIKDRISASGRVHLCLSGHYHVGADVTRTDGTWYATARAFCQAPHPWRIYNVDVDGVSQTEHTVESPRSGPALFLDLAFAKHLLQDPASVKALNSVTGGGRPIIGLAEMNEGDRQAFERSIDTLAARFDRSGCPLEGVVHHRSEDRTDDYERVIRILGVDPGASNAVCGNDRDAEAARACGIGVETVTRDTVRPVLQRLVP